MILKIKENEDGLKNIVILGNIKVGKTSIIKRYVSDIFENDYRSTIGISLASKKIWNENEPDMNLQLWNTSGNENFQTMMDNCIKNSSIAVVVYDITDTSTFDSVRGWIDKIMLYKGD